MNWEEYWIAKLFKERLIDKKKQDSYHNYCQKICNASKAIWQTCQIANKPGSVCGYLLLI